jgi:N-acyl-D-amino-acid deacylase
MTHLAWNNGTVRCLASLFLFSIVSLAQQYDLLITGGKIIDGTGAGWFRADVAVNGDTIAAVGKLDSATAKRVIRANGLVVTPGFIDIHSHAGSGLGLHPKAENLVRQGVTAVLEGNDGASPIPLGPALDRISKTQIGINIGYFAGQGSIRQSVMGLVNRPATPEELDRMRALTKQAMLDGAFGLSTGLFYVPGNFSPPGEVIEVAKIAAQFGGMHISHMRSESDAILEAVEETIDIGEKAGMPTQVSHHKIIGLANWGKSADTLRLIDQARERGVDVTVDQYPYTASSTGTAALFPQWSLEGGQKALLERLAAPDTRARIKAAIVHNILVDRGAGNPKNVVIASCGFDKTVAGKNLADLAAAKGLPVTPENGAEAALDLQSKGGCSAIYHAIGEADLVRIMKYPFTMIASDGFIPTFGEGHPHPRSYGTWARVLGVYVREQHVLSLEEAVRRMTSLPAARLKLMDRGILRPGMKADIAVFDPLTVRDKATFDQPHQYAEGFVAVLVNGVPVLAEGKMTGVLPGKVLRNIAGYKSTIPVNNRLAEPGSGTVPVLPKGPL